MLRSSHRVGRESFAEVMKGGYKISTPLFLVRYIKNNDRTFRCSAVVSKKIEKTAVNRNNFRRRVYHAVHEIIKDGPFPKAHTVIFFARVSLKKISFESLKSEIKDILGKTAL